MVLWMKILFIPDVVGKPGRRLVKMFLSLFGCSCWDFIIVNAENSAGGLGLTRSIVDEFFDIGIDVITTGNHVWDRRKEIFSFIDEYKNLLRPANYPSYAPGRGYTIVEKNNLKLAVINLQGRVMLPPIDCPFQVGERIIEEIRNITNCIFIDMHAEATSEKKALALYFDGKVSAVVGTHTHVMTCDEQILKKGTAFITDAGMVGAHGGVIGMEKDVILRRFLTGIPYPMEVSKENLIFNGVEITIDNVTGRAFGIRRLVYKEKELV